MEMVKRINNLFSTADADNINYSSDGYSVVLRFNDWQGSRYTLSFDDVEYLKVSEQLDEGKYRYDCPHEVLESELIRKLKLSDDKLHHYMLCFNAWSNFEIISEQLTIVSIEAARDA